MNCFRKFLRQITHSPEKGGHYDQSNNYTQVQLGVPMVFTLVSNSNIKGLHLETKKIQKEICHKKPTLSFLIAS